MGSDFEERLQELEDKVGSMEGAEPSTREPGGATVTLAQTQREVMFLWQSIKDIREEMQELRAMIPAQPVKPPKPTK